jgi:adenosylcobinamide-phosphate synthase
VCPHRAEISRVSIGLWPVAEPVALVALALDAAIGWPAWLYRRIGHPIGLFARILDMCEQAWNRPDRSFAARRALGVLTMALLIGTVGGASWLLQRAVLEGLGPIGWLVCALLAFPALAQRSLEEHVRAVALALERGDLPAARTAVAQIVGRDPDALDAAGVSRAAIESLSESFCDGVAAPLFWLLGLGLPGVWVYKAINTADSMIGHREPRWRAFGWAAARIDDGANLIPARLAGIAICLAAGKGWRTMARDAGKHASPNAGWTEAAMAGALDLRLVGPVWYDGVLHDKPWIGAHGRSDAGAVDIRRALVIYRRACLLLWAIAGGLAWAL